MSGWGVWFRLEEGGGLDGLVAPPFEAHAFEVFEGGGGWNETGLILPLLFFRMEAEPEFDAVVFVCEAAEVVDALVFAGFAGPTDSRADTTLAVEFPDGPDGSSVAEEEGWGGALDFDGFLFVGGSGFAEPILDLGYRWEVPFPKGGGFGVGRRHLAEVGKECVGVLIILGFQGRALGDGGAIRADLTPEGAIAEGAPFIGRGELEDGAGLVVEVFGSPVGDAFMGEQSWDDTGDWAPCGAGFARVWDGQGELLHFRVEDTAAGDAVEACAGRDVTDDGGIDEVVDIIVAEFGGAIAERWQPCAAGLGGVPAGWCSDASGGFVGVIEDAHPHLDGGFELACELTDACGVGEIRKRRLGRIAGVSGGIPCEEFAFSGAPFHGPCECHHVIP